MINQFFQGKKRASKYNVTGKVSRLEQAVGDMLYHQQKLGLISDLETQVRVNICCREMTTKCGCQGRIASVVDFVYLDHDSKKKVFVEVKGFVNERWSIKRRLWMNNGKGVLLVYGGSYKSPEIKETIEPRWLNQTSEESCHSRKRSEKR